MSTFQVGQIIAKQGAYNRKYRILNITQVHREDETPSYKQWVVELQPLGSFYQDGRAFPSRKGTPSREVLCWGGDTPYLNYYVVDSGNYFKDTTNA